MDFGDFIALFPSETNAFHLKTFEDAGYYLLNLLLDASKMGVPQMRNRVFFLYIDMIH